MDRIDIILGHFIPSRAALTDRRSTILVSGASVSVNDCSNPVLIGGMVMDVQVCHDLQNSISLKFDLP